MTVEEQHQLWRRGMHVSDWFCEFCMVLFEKRKHNGNMN